MKLTRLVAVLALGLVSGCGGCESCFGGSGAPTSDHPGPIASPDELSRDAMAGDAGPAPAEDASRPDAGLPPAPTAITLLRDASAPLLRPKSPMPTGAYQACGVYDGPLCQKPCANGACRQECDGVACLLTCAGGYCSQLCGLDGTCEMTCAGGHCTQACTKAEGCTKECSGGNCN